MPGREAGKPALTSEESAHRAARARWKRSRALGTHPGKPRETLGVASPAGKSRGGLQSSRLCLSAPAQSSGLT